MEYALVIDDEPLISRVIIRILKTCGLGLEDFLTADDGQAGLDLFRQNSASSNECLLVISDYNMPRMTGEELARALREQEHYQGPIAILSGTNDEQRKQRLETELGVTCFDKPLDPDTLRVYAQQAVNKYRSQLPNTQSTEIK